MGKYRKRSMVVEVEAFKWTGDQDQTEDPVWIVEKIMSGAVRIAPYGEAMFILPDVLIASPGDYIVRDDQGRIYTCPSDIFEATYERVTEE